VNIIFSYVVILKEAQKIEYKKKVLQVAKRAGWLKKPQNPLTEFKHHYLYETTDIIPDDISETGSESSATTADTA
jgi:hypothetical protein